MINPISTPVSMLYSPNTQRLIPDVIVQNIVSFLSIECRAKIISVSKQFQKIISPLGEYAEYNTLRQCGMKQIRSLALEEWNALESKPNKFTNTIQIPDENHEFENSFRYTFNAQHRILRIWQENDDSSKLVRLVRVDNLAVFHNFFQFYNILCFEGCDQGYKKIILWDLIQIVSGSKNIEYRINFNDPDIDPDYRSDIYPKVITANKYLIFQYGCYFYTFQFNSKDNTMKKVWTKYFNGILYRNERISVLHDDKSLLVPTVFNLYVLNLANGEVENKISWSKPVGLRFIKLHNHCIYYIPHESSSMDLFVLNRYVKKKQKPYKIKINNCSLRDLSISHVKNQLTIKVVSENRDPMLFLESSNIVRTAESFSALSRFNEIIFSTSDERPSLKDRVKFRLSPYLNVVVLVAMVVLGIYLVFSIDTSLKKFMR